MSRVPLLQTVIGLSAGFIAAQTALKFIRTAALQGEVALITGASRGLGLLLAHEFGRQGCQVAICAREQEELDQAYEQLHRWGVDSFPVICDVSDRNDVDVLIRTVTERYGRIDILVNNAGTIQVTPVQSAELEDFEQAMGTMFWGGLYTTLALLPQMQERGSGRIVNITSVGGKTAVPHLLPYVAAKFAMTGFSEGLTAELAGSGIQVTTIVPGLMRTGSYLNAFFKGHHQDEFRWFSIADNLPFLSINAEAAARTIVQAVARGETEYVLTIPAKLLTRFYGLLPGVAIQIFGGTSALILPEGTDNPVAERGMDINRRMNEPLLQRLTAWGIAAAWRFNQYSAPASKPPYHVEPQQTEPTITI
jgi:NAD(P)-dependent dehydrogenase (short-subunit alcohol dehydrogenase family)